ncbi:MAG TPA: hypothetical protein DIW30_08675 [Bacteroidales bacterium]|nr:hypothetical protein [Bacteroidales bacterium]
MNDSLISPDNVYAIDSILSQVTLINYNTDGTSGWTPFFNGAAFIASIVTILGILGVYKWYHDSKISRMQKVRILEDIVRHLFVNIAIIEILRDKLEKKGYSYGYPDEGIFRRLAFLPEDCNFHRLSSDAALYGTMHEMELLMRNYGISAEVACSHFTDPDIGEQTRKDNLEDLIQRSVKLIYETEKLILYFKAGRKERRKIFKLYFETSTDSQTKQTKKCCLCRAMHTLIGKMKKMCKCKSKQTRNERTCLSERTCPIGTIVAERYKHHLDSVGELSRIKHYPEVVKLMQERGAESVFDKYVTWRIADKHLYLIPFNKQQ